MIYDLIDFSVAAGSFLLSIRPTHSESYSPFFGLDRKKLSTCCVLYTVPVTLDCLLLVDDNFDPSCRDAPGSCLLVASSIKASLAAVEGGFWEGLMTHSNPIFYRYKARHNSKRRPTRMGGAFFEGGTFASSVEKEIEVTGRIRLCVRKVHNLGILSLPGMSGGGCN